MDIIIDRRPVNDSIIFRRLIEACIKIRTRYICPSLSFQLLCLLAAVALGQSILPRLILLWQIVYHEHHTGAEILSAP